MWHTSTRKKTNKQSIQWIQSQAGFFTKDMQSFIRDILQAENSKELDTLVPDFTKSFPLLLDSDNAISSSSILCSLLNIYIKIRKLVALASVNKGKASETS